MKSQLKVAGRSPLGLLPLGSGLVQLELDGSRRVRPAPNLPTRSTTLAPVASSRLPAAASERAPRCLHPQATQWSEYWRDEAPLFRLRTSSLPCARPLLEGSCRKTPSASLAPLPPEGSRATSTLK